MSEPPWGPKPPPVDDVERYWIEAPPSPSPRCAYWVRRYREGSWRPNKWVRREGYHSRAEMLGVYIWEATHTIADLIAEDEAALAAS
jgi:hypothetical protein